MTQRMIAFLPFVATLDAATLAFLADAATGYDILPVICDGLFSACDMHLGPGPRAANACMLCQAHAAGRMAETKMPYRWLGRWAEPDDTRVASAWVSALRPQEYPFATNGRWHLGACVTDSARRHLGGPFDPANASHGMVFASHLFSAHLAATALDRLLADQAPDALFLPEQKSALARTALTVAQRHALAVVCIDP